MLGDGVLCLHEPMHHGIPRWQTPWQLVPCPAMPSLQNNTPVSTALGPCPPPCLLHLAQAVGQGGQLALHHLKPPRDAQPAQPQPPILCTGAASRQGRRVIADAWQVAHAAACHMVRCDWAWQQMAFCRHTQPHPPSSRMLEGFRSQCKMPLECKCCTAAARSRPSRSTAALGRQQQLK